MGLKDELLFFLFVPNRPGFLLTATALVILEIVVTYGIIQKIPYTEIDWSTYMQQVECYVNKNEMNYSRIEGDTGPIVYPGGHLIVYRIFYALTNKGQDIRVGQYIFMILYLINLISVFRLYSKTRLMPPFVLFLLTCTGYRIHSLFVLRLFNDTVAMTFLYLALNFFVSQKWLAGSLLFSAAFSIKMNIFLFAPALGCILLLNTGLAWTVLCGLAAGLLQLYVAFPFILYDPISYIRRSFDLGRVFMFKWTVNWRFLPEELFLDNRFHLALFLTMVLLWAVFGFHMWFRSMGGLRVSFLTLFRGIRSRTGPGDTLFALFTANLIGIACARSLHYQFYSWYYHQLPLLLFFNYPLPTSDDEKFPIPWKSIIAKTCVLLAVEVCWCTYPSTNISSLALHVIHFGILFYLVRTRESHKRKHYKLY
ncbi:unnamed protein product, partial [Mesorhabditis spiculigera]